MKAIRFNASGQDLATTKGMLPARSGGFGFTVACWLRLAVDRDTHQTFWESEAGGNDRHTLRTDNTGTGLEILGTIGTGFTKAVTTLAIGEWVFACVVTVPASYSFTVYYRRRGESSLSSVSDSSSELGEQGAPSNFRVGGSVVAGEWSNGNVVGVKAWGIDLTAAEVLLESRYLEPRTRIADLIRFNPLVSHRTMYHDFSGHGAHFESGGAGVAFEDAKIGLIVPSRRVLIPVGSGVTAGPTTITASGTPAIALPTASGAAKNTAKASGTPAIALPTASGAARTVHKASGAPTIPLPTAAGAATHFSIKTASGAPVMPLPTASGAARKEVTSSGAASTPVPTAAGAARTAHKATGTPAIALPSASGAAKRSITGSGAMTIPLPLASGAANVFGVISASGALVISLPTASGVAIGPEADKLGDPGRRRRPRGWEPFDAQYFANKYRRQALERREIEVTTDSLPEIQAEQRAELATIDEDIRELEAELERYQTANAEQAAEIEDASSAIRELEVMIELAYIAKRRQNDEIAALIALALLF